MVTTTFRRVMGLVCALALLPVLAMAAAPASAAPPNINVSPESRSGPTVTLTIGGHGAAGIECVGHVSNAVYVPSRNAVHAQANTVCNGPVAKLVTAVYLWRQKKQNVNDWQYLGGALVNKRDVTSDSAHFFYPCGNNNYRIYVARGYHEVHFYSGQVSKGYTQSHTYTSEPCGA
jgi:hypothetical protein